MGQMIKVRAVPREGFNHFCTPGRFWPSGSEVDVEVLDQDEDPAPLVEEALSTDTGKIVTRLVHTLDKIGRKTYAELRDSPFIKIVADGETSNEISQAAVDSARKQAAELSAKLVDAEMKVATLGEQLTKARERIAQLESDLAIALQPQATTEKPSKKAK